MAAAKVLDAIARMPGMDGEDSDATGAYTQAQHLGEETWVTMPRNQWPKEWRSHNNGKGYNKPVVRLQLSLYGHPLAGLYWEIHCKQQVKKCGFEPVKGWECLYVNKVQKLFLSIYVDDFKMAGKASSLKPMWEKLNKVLELEKPQPLQKHTYLGCGQAPEPIDEDIVKNKWKLWHTLTKPDDFKDIEEDEDKEIIDKGKPFATVPEPKVNWKT